MCIKFAGHIEAASGGLASTIATMIHDEQNRVNERTRELVEPSAEAVAFVAERTSAQCAVVERVITRRRQLALCRTRTRCFLTNCQCVVNKPLATAA